VYVAWFVIYGRQAEGLSVTNLPLDAIPALPQFVLTGVGNAIGSISGLGNTVGLTIWLLLVGVLLWQWIARASINPLLAAGVVGIAVEFASGWAVRSHLDLSQATAPRYVYPAAVLLFVAVTGVIAGAPRPRFRNAVGTLTAGALLLAALVTNVTTLFAGRDAFQSAAMETNAVLEIAAQFPDAQAFRGPVNLSPYGDPDEIAAYLREVGSPIRDNWFPELVARPEPARYDGALRRLFNDQYSIQPTDQGGQLLPQLVRTSEVEVSRSGGCLTVRPEGEDPHAVFAVASGERLLMRASAAGDLQVFWAMRGEFVEEGSKAVRVVADRWYTISAPDLDTAVWSIRVDPPLEAVTSELCREAA